MTDKPPTPGPEIELSSDDIVDEIKSAGVPLTVRMIADRKDVSHQTVYNRLEEINDNQLVEIQYGNSKAYWIETNENNTRMSNQSNRGPDTNKSLQNVKEALKTALENTDMSELPPIDTPIVQLGAVTSESDHSHTTVNERLKDLVMDPTNNVKSGTWRDETYYWIEPDGKEPQIPDAKQQSLWEFFILTESEEKLLIALAIMLMAIGLICFML